MRIFVAGATGAMGLPLVRALCALGHQVTGMTRPGPGVDRLRELGAAAANADAFDPKAVQAAIKAATPDVVIDQLTWLPANPADIIKSLPNDTRLHREGGGSLLAAARELGVDRYIVQSRGFYLDAPAGQLGDESAKLRYDAPGAVGESIRTMHDYEDRILASSSMQGVVLRYGFFYGPGTWYRPDGAIADQVRRREAAIIGEGNAVWSFVHIDDAVAATVASLTAESGIYNVVDDDPLPVAEWLPAFARWVDAPEPPRVSVKDALKTGRRGSGLLPHEADRGLEQSREGATRVHATVALVERRRGLNAFAAYDHPVSLTSSSSVSELIPTVLGRASGSSLRWTY